MMATPVCGHRRGVDDAATRAEVAHRGSGHEEHPEDVGAEGALELAAGDLLSGSFGR
jgi:hypothetical protein